MSFRASCPFCNAAFDLPAAATARRVPCPRCGEPVPVKASSGDGAAEPPTTDPEPGSLRAEVPAARGGSRGRQLAGIGLAIASFAVGGVLVSLATRTPPAPPTVPTPPKPPSVWPPAAVPGLAYLPADVNVVAVVQPRPLAQYAERAKADPSALPDAARKALDRLGLPPDQIDHVAAGVQLTDDNPFPRLVVALTVVPPVDEAALLKAWKAARDPDRPDRFRVDLGGLPLDLTKDGDHVFVFASRGSDLEDLPARTGRGSVHLPPDVRDAMARLSPATAAWAATGVARWADKAAVKLGSQLLKRDDWPKRLAGVRQAAVGVSLEPGPKLTAAVRGEPAADGEKRLSEVLGDGATFGRDGEWVTGVRNLDLPAAPTGGK